MTTTAMPIEDHVFSPQQVSTKAYSAIEDRHANKDGEMLTGIPSLDNVLVPMRKGELIIVCGYTSNYKTGTMTYIARHNARKLAEEGDFTQDQRRAIIMFTWEQSVEEQGIVDIAQLTGINAVQMMRGELPDDSWTTLRHGAVERGSLPWWVIGHSNSSGKRRPRMTLSDAATALAWIADVQGIKPAMVILDYVQRIRPEKDGERRGQMMDIVDRCKDMALAFECPVLLGSQAGRGVKDRQWRLPQLDDGQESSNIEQSADKFLSVWMPKTDFPIGTPLQGGPKNATVDITENLLIMGVMKQKFGPAPRILFLHVNPEVNEISPMQFFDLNQ